jgi:hypothetical protein
MIVIATALILFLLFVLIVFGRRPPVKSSVSESLESRGIDAGVSAGTEYAKTYSSSPSEEEIDALYERDYGSGDSDYQTWRFTREFRQGYLDGFRKAFRKVRGSTFP